MIQAETTAARL